MPPTRSGSKGASGKASESPDVTPATDATSNRFGDEIRSRVELDDVDHTVIRLLSDDARLSVRELSRRIGMSAGAISERVARLEREGVILGYHAHVDPAALGYGMLAIVGLRMAHGPSLNEALERLSQIPEAERIFVVTGDSDLILHIRVRDHHHLSEVLFDRIWRFAGFEHSVTAIAMHERSGPAGEAPRGSPPASRRRRRDQP